MRRKLISIVTPCYNEELNVRDCYHAVKRVFQQQLGDYDYEHVFCDNASTDDSCEILRELAEEDSRVKVIFNARNYGPFRSTFNALLSTQGDAVVVLLAADLQDPPEVVVSFVEEWERGHEVVYGIRANREEGWVMRNTRRLYYRLVSFFAEMEIPPDVGEFQLIDKRVVNELRQFDDYYPYIRGMIAACGFRVKGVPYTWKARKKGFSKNRLFHLIDQGLNGLISFTRLPMRLCLFVGFGLSAISIIYAAITLVLHLTVLQSVASPGMATIIVALFFFAGVQLFFLGLLGEYLSAVHFQVRRRPLVSERERLNFADPILRATPSAEPSNQRIADSA